MQAFRSHLALLLLLCLTRTLLPEAWILGLHTHAHTSAEPAHAAAFAHRGKALLSARHQHCTIEQFYHVAYQAAVPVAVPRPRLAPPYAALAAPLATKAAVEPLVGLHGPRGPPRRA